MLDILCFPKWLSGLLLGEYQEIKPSPETGRSLHLAKFCRFWSRPHFFALGQIDMRACARRYVIRHVRPIYCPSRSIIYPRPSIQSIHSSEVAGTQYRPFASLQSKDTVIPGHFNLRNTKDDTIYALSTASGRAAIAIIRISGPACLDVYRTLCPQAASIPTVPPLKPRHATLRSLFSAKSEILDTNAIVIHFPSPLSATGEDVLELHIHGGPATVKAVLAAVSKTKASSGSTVRYAEPGEFTRRAFYHNRLDLTQIEALGDSLAAETEHQRRLAVQGASNVLIDQYETWRELLLKARGRLEALIDFSEDQHFDESPAKLMSDVSKEIAFLRGEMGLAIQNSSRGEFLRNGIKVALLGAPNAGKSTLLNKIVGREAAIVSKEPGTTRDVVEVNVDIGGFFCNFGDLAGLRDTVTENDQLKRSVGAIEAEGIRRAKERVLSADVVILVAAIPIKPSKNSDSRLQIVLKDEILDVLHKCDWSRQRLVFVCNKLDLASKWKNIHITTDLLQARVPTEIWDIISSPLPLSCNESEDVFGPERRQMMLDTFLDRLKETFQEMTSIFEPLGVEHDLGPTFLQGSLGATERQRLLLVECQKHLDNFLARCQRRSDTSANEPEELDFVVAAEDLRAAADCLGKITGRGESGDVEEVLGVVFEKYVCLI